MIDANAHRKVIANVKNHVLRHHININHVDYDEWTRLVDADTERVASADKAEFETGIQKWLTELKSCHSVFYHDVPSSFPAQYTIGSTLRSCDWNGQQRWMFLGVMDGGVAKAAGIKPGDVLLRIDGAEPIPPEQPKFRVNTSYDFVVGQGASRAEAKLKITLPPKKATASRPPIIEPASISTRMVEPSLGLLKVNYFPGSFGLRFAKLLDAAIRDLTKHGATRLILDLRGNIGGSLGFARLASYMCQDQRAIGYSVTPQRLRAGVISAELPRVPMPGSAMSLMSALIRSSRKDKSLMLLTQGLGPRPFHNRVVVLVNEWTTSAGEMAASFIAENHLGTTIGETTRGAVLGAANFKVGSGYWLRIPIFGWFTPDGRSLEGKGVAPQIPCLIDAEALASEHDTQFESALQIARTI